MATWKTINASLLRWKLTAISNQQSVINQGKVSDIEITSIIDHPAYRKMIADLVTQKNNGACLKLLAIDGAGADIDMRRDAWMARDWMR